MNDEPVREAETETETETEAAETFEIVARCERGEISPAVALMQLLIAAEDADVVAGVLRELQSGSPVTAPLQDLFEAHQDGCRRVAAMLRADVDVPPPPGASVEEGIAYSRALFDWSVRQSETASVALYSLGSPALLAAATAEVVGLLEDWGLLEDNIAILDIGCGTGRLEEALAPKAGRIHGMDISAEMVAVARRRCRQLANVSVALSSGLDLDGIQTASFDLVLAVDSFPYLVQAGDPLVETMFAEAARVLRVGGDFVILNYSYRGDRARDRREAQVLAHRHRFEVLADGALPFKLWDADAYRLRKGSNR